jgi:hypothetical protein
MKALLLTPDKDALWKKWFGLYRQKMISSGEFLDLYTVGFDVPEGYAIRKDQKMYYAFFTPPNRPWGLDKPPDLPPSRDEVWEGRLELRGLDKSKEYEVVDYEHGKSLGSLKGSSPYLLKWYRSHESGSAALPKFTSRGTQRTADQPYPIGRGGLAVCQDPAAHRAMLA